MSDSFVRHGPAVPTSPVVLSVPHAGRGYPATLLGALAVPLATARMLEDRHVDTLALTAQCDEMLLIATRARAWIDLNRGEQERDPRVDEGAPAGRVPPGHTKLRSGLGLVPRRAGGAEPLWRRRFSAIEVEDRIAADHRPYHSALAQTLAAARARFGIAILLDLHSMPPLDTGAAFVIGDRFGRSAAARFVARLEAEAGTLPIALNAPYAGGHILDRHGDPEGGIHALQLEVDRSRYLDRELDRPGPGLQAVAAIVRRMIDALADEAISVPLSQAAE